VQLLDKDGSNRELNLPDGIRINKEYDQLIIGKARKAAASFFYTVSLIPKSIPIREIKKEMRFILLKKKKNRTLTSQANIAYLDYHKVKIPLIIRNFAPGDWFYPSGMTGRKKVQDFFVDKKIPFSQRRNIPLLIFDDRIAWIGGFRVDQEMAATAETREILKVALKSL
jgi:tRNA(Ile)-lysidine synthase